MQAVVLITALGISLMALGEILPWYLAVPAAIAVSVFIASRLPD